jgi:cobalt-zinc-cadmium efflux system membrane fusion protein
MRDIRTDWSLVLGIVLLLPGCQPAGTKVDKPPAPAKVTGTPKEDQLTTVELTEAAVKRLGIETAVVEVRNLAQGRTYGGEIMLPIGATVIVSAPVAGLLKSPADIMVLKAGSAVVARQVLLTLLPLLSPERAVLTPAERITLAVARNGVATQRVDAAGQVQQAQTQLDAARIALDRAERLSKDGAGSARTVDEAKAQQTLSQKALEAATSRKKIVDEIRLDDEQTGEQTPLLIEAPQTGIVRAMHALPGEVVTAGAPLFEVMNADTLWVRVPVYVGETSMLALDQAAEVGELAARPGDPRLPAQPIAAPPTATALASTLDLYYELKKTAGRLRPGQRVSVQLPLAGRTEQRAIPWSAVVQDIHGGHWVYEKTADRTFVRRRVQIKQVIDTWAIIEQGPSPGTTIVVTGVAELFGTEFGFGK